MARIDHPSKLTPGGQLATLVACHVLIGPPLGIPFFFFLLAPFEYGLLPIATLTQELLTTIWTSPSMVMKSIALLLFYRFVFGLPAAVLNSILCGAALELLQNWLRLLCASPPIGAFSTFTLYSGLGWFKGRDWQPHLSAQLSAAQMLIVIGAVASFLCTALAALVVFRASRTR